MILGIPDISLLQTLDVIRVKLKILRLEPKPLKPILKVSAPNTTDGKLDVPKNPAPRSVTPNTLKPPGPDPKKHRRTVSLELPPKDPPPSAVVTAKVSQMSLDDWNINQMLSRNGPPRPISNSKSRYLGPMLPYEQDSGLMLLLASQWPVMP